MAIVAGFGRSSEHNWGYISGMRAVMVQTNSITDPSLISDDAVIDTTIRRTGGSTIEIGRDQDLLIGVVLLDGTLAADARIGLWLDLSWGGVLYDADASQHSSSSNTIPTSSSSDAAPVTDVIELLSAASVGPVARWGLVAVEGPVPTGAGYGVADRSIAVVFTDLVAGRYKAAVYTGLTGSAVITEQHTE